jgi:uncharacterized protein
LITELVPETIETIKNPKFKSYASMYQTLYDKFIASVETAGLELEPQDDREQMSVRRAHLAGKGAVVRNDGKSVYVNWISPSCEACRTGLGMATMFISLKCHRQCYFCFNPNQEDYAHYSENIRDSTRELERIYANGARLDHVGLTGGEPLLHKAETVEFFRFARLRFPNARSRLYTSGDFLEEEILTALQAVRLEEIRVSIRLFDDEPARRHTFDQLALARTYIPNVMVEMPVLPDSFEEMKQVLMELERLQIRGINLLEFCFPLRNAQVYQSKGYRIRHRPYRVPYNYAYAGGLPVAGSESACLELVEFAIDEGLKLGVHYCSVENKHTGEVYQQSYERKIPPQLSPSRRDYFLKSAKVFGKDIPKVLQVLEENGCTDYDVSRRHHYLQFGLEQIKHLGALDVEIAVSTSLMEDRPDGEYLRELQVGLTTPQTFDPTTDV